MDRFDPFVKYADVYGDIINWEKDPMNKPQNQNKYFFSDGKTYYEQICKMLRLMSVFKEAFNQIYSNEDEISEAWENFVNNLSASVVEGSEPDVTLTWTDDSVNFEFTMVPGVPGEQGVGITSISFNSDYTMTITLSDGNTYTSMSLKGETGPQGPQGETGSGLQILDVYATLADLQSAHPSGQPGDAYQVGSAGNYTLYIWSSSQSAWVPAGSLGTVSPSVSNPLMDGTASAGSSNLYSRGDHVHPSDTSRASKEELDALIRTSQSLIDQSFTYRKSPAIQDGLARIDKIKGNTLVWNQLVQNGNFADSSKWTSVASATINSVSNNTINVTTSATAQSGISNPNISMVQGHKYLLMGSIKTTGQTYISISGVGTVLFNTNSFVTKSNIFTWTSSSGAWACMIRNWDTNSATFEAKNIMLFDLTQMGLDISADEFVSLFNLPYYDYNAGSLLSFNGNGLKTVGKNRWDSTRLYGDSSSATLNNGVYTKNASGSNWILNTEANSYGAMPVLFEANQSIVLSYKTENSTINSAFLCVVYEDGTTRNFPNAVDGFTTVLPKKVVKAGIVLYGTFTANSSKIYDIQLEVGNVPSSYDPYTESTISLPVSISFPSGMKSAGNAYDELTPIKAITRIGAVDLGTLTWERTTTQGSDYRFFSSGIASVIKKPNSLNDVANIICSKYQAERGNGPNAQEVGVGIHTNGNVLIYDTVYASATAEEFKSAMSGVYLYYELATPVETDVDLDLDFMAYEDGTEQLLPVNGPVPSTSPILADITYLSIDDAMTYILEKLESIPEQTEQRLEALEDDVTDLQTDVGELQPAVSSLQTSVGNINTNIGQLSSTVAAHTASISDIQSDITDINDDVSDLGVEVGANTGMINQLTSSLSSTDGRVQNLETSVSGLDSTVTDQGETVTALDSIIQDISNNPVVGSLGQHELGFVAAYVSATLAANTGTKVTIPKPTIFPNNYTPLFIVGMTTGSYNVSICEIPYSFGNRDSVDCRVWNHGGQQTTQITVYILCMRQRQSQ